MIRILFGFNSKNNGHDIQSSLQKYNLTLYNKMVTNWQYCNNIIEPDFSSFTEITNSTENNKLAFSICRIFYPPTGKGFIYTKFSKPIIINIYNNKKRANNIIIKSLQCDLTQNNVSKEKLNFSYYGFALVFYKLNNTESKYTFDKTNIKNNFKITKNNYEYNIDILNPTSVKKDSNNIFLSQLSGVTKVKLEEEEEYKTNNNNNSKNIGMLQITNTNINTQSKVSVSNILKKFSVGQQCTIKNDTGYIIENINGRAGTEWPYKNLSKEQCQSLCKNTKDCESFWYYTDVNKTPCYLGKGGTISTNKYDNRKRWVGICKK